MNGAIIPHFPPRCHLFPAARRLVARESRAKRRRYANTEKAEDGAAIALDFVDGLTGVAVEGAQIEVALVVL